MTAFLVASGAAQQELGAYCADNAHLNPTSYKAVLHQQMQG